MAEIDLDAVDRVLEAIRTDSPAAYVSGWKIERICQPGEYTLCMSTSSKSEAENIAGLFSGRFEILATSDGDNVNIDFTRIVDE